MKKSFLLPFCLVMVTTVFAQKQPSATAEKSLPPHNPTILGDFLPPSLECTNGLSANLMPTQLIQLYASDFLKQVSDNATPTHLIQIALRKAGTGTGFPTSGQGIPATSIAFGCSEQGVQPIELWARDLAGNTSVCETFIIIQDNNANCNAGSSDYNLRVCASMLTGNVGVEEVQYQISGFNPNGPFVGTQVNDPGEACGLFDVSVGSTVTAQVLKDDNPLNGVTTYDRVLIQKHIENLELLNSPYKMIAADINKDGVISDLDIIDLTNLILGVTTEFPNNSSWRFIPKDYVFPDPNNPFAHPFPETSTVENLQGLANLEFIAIKVGDVNYSAVANGIGVIDERGVGGTIRFGQPSPNPTTGDALLPLFLVQAENVRFELLDLNGRLCWSEEIAFGKGAQMLEIPASAMPETGVYVWRVRAGASVQSGKLVRQ